jgi:glycosyltransferase involved in cell wall biosynthesis
MSHTYPTNTPASILCVGMGWFPVTSGGLNRYLYELSHQLVRVKDQVEVCGVGLPDAEPDSSIMLTNLASPDSSLLPRLWSTRKQFAQRHLKMPDAINLHFALYSFPLLEDLPKNVPVTFNFQGSWAMESAFEVGHKRKFYVQRWLEQQVYRRCDRFIVLSKSFGQSLHEIYGVSWDKIHVIPGGVDVTAFQPTHSRAEARAELGWQSDRKILFTPRRLVRRMGLDKLLTAMVKVKQQVPDVWLGIAGKGYMRPELEQQIEELGLGEHVKLLGFVPDQQLPIAYQAADLTVVPSQSLEGFGLILVESLACGTPALCTPVGGMPEIVSPFSPDLVTATADSDAIADRLIDLLTDQIPLPTQAACREYACQQYDWRLITPRVRDILLA